MISSNAGYTAINPVELDKNKQLTTALHLLCLQNKFPRYVLNSIPDWQVVMHIPAHKKLSSLRPLE